MRRRPHRTGADLLHQPGHRGHVAVLEADPDEVVTALGRGPQLATALDRRGQRLLHQDVDGVGQHVEHDVAVGVVGGGHHDHVAQPGGQQVPVVGEVREGGPTLPGGQVGQLPRPLVGVGDGRDLRPGDVLEVPQVLDAHHPGPDEAVADGRGVDHGRSVPRDGRRLRRRRRGGAVAVAVAALVLLVGACGSADDGGEDASAGAPTDSSPGSPTSTTAPGTSSTAPPGAPTSSPDPGDRLGPDSPARLTFRPVLEAAVGCATTPEAPLDEAVLPVADPAPGPCARVGPIGFDGTAVAEAEVARSGAGDGTWQVIVTIAPDGRAAAGALFDACAEAGPSCPDDGSGHGRVAVVVDGEVVSSPTVTSTGLADDAVAVAGDLTRAEAEDLAASLGT